MHISTDPHIELTFRYYPPPVRKKLLSIRKLIRKIARESESITELVETLKWGEPSFMTKQGSTVRLSWQEKHPDHFRVMFHCQTSLVKTFRELYPSVFEYEGKRALVFATADEIPEKELTHCLSLALHYHRIKALPLLGVPKNELVSPSSMV